MTDISSFEDVIKVVDFQYNKLLENDLTRKHFEHLNLSEHLPRIYTFWTFVLDIDAVNHPYQGSAYGVHTKLGLQNLDFEIWQDCLQLAVNSQFSGEKASLMIDKAIQLGMMFQYKLGLLDIKEDQ